MNSIPENGMPWAKLAFSIRQTERHLICVHVDTCLLSVAKSHNMEL
jgi:hypothetical protein